MFDRFLHESRVAMAHSRRAADELGHAFISSEHLLLGWMRVPRSYEILRGLGIQPDQLEEAVRGLVRIGPSRVIARQMPFTPTGKQVLELGCEHANWRGGASIELQDLLVGLFRVPDAISSKALAEAGLTEERLATLASPPPTDEEPHRG